MTADASPYKQTPDDWPVRLGVRAGYLAGVLGVAGFMLALIAPRETVERASDPMWLTAALVGWLSTLLALVFLVGLGAAADRPSVVGRVALALAIVSTGAGAARHSRVLVEYAAFDLDPAFATRLHDTQTPLAQGVFVGIATLAALSWLIAAIILARDARISRAGRIAIGAAGLGIMLPVPLTALALLLASSALSKRSTNTLSAATHQHR